MDVSMDTVSVQIETVVNESNKAIGSLIHKLNSLQNALKNVVKASGSLSEISKSMNNINNKTASSFVNKKSQINNQSKNPSLQSQLSTLGVSLNQKEMISSVKSINNETTKYKNNLNQVITVQKKMKNGMEDYKVSVREASKQTNGFEKFKNSIAGTITKIGLLWGTINKVKNSMMESVDLSASYVESLNLFFTEMGEKGEEAYQWVQKFSNALYLDPADVMQYMGAFNSLVSGLGVGADRSYLMSKNLTQLTYDLASYKNLDFSTAYEKLMSGISGEIEPLRNTGVALSQATLQELANSMGIQQRINTMNEAQKAELRYIQIIRSSTNWQADLGKTLMSTENILKIAGQQWVLFKRALGDVATVIIRYMLPYMIALTQILTESAKALAKFLGFDIDFSKYKTDTKSVSTGIKEIGTSADTATKKLNTMLAPFDKLNVVQNKNESASSGLGGVGSGGGLGVDLPEYDALSKLTDEMSDQIEKAKKQIKSLIPIVKKVATVLATLWALNKISNFINALKNIKSVFTLLKTPIIKLLPPLKTLITRFSDGYKYSKFMGEKGLTSVLAGSRNLLGTLGKVSVTLAGVVVSFATGYKEMKNYATGSQELGSALLKTTAVTTAFGAAAFALVGWPAALAVGVAGLTGILIGYSNGLEQLRIEEEKQKAYDNLFSSQGVHLEALQGHLETTAEKWVESTSKMEESSSKYNTLRDRVSETKTSIEKFKEQLILSGEVISKQDFTSLIEQYNTLGNLIVDSAEAEYNYTKTVMEEAQKRGLASKEEAKAIIDSQLAILKSTKQSEENRRLAMENLKTQLEHNMITESKYREQVERLNEIYGITTSSLDNVNVANQYFQDLMDKGINTKDAEKLPSIVNEITKSYNESKKAIETKRETEKKAYEDNVREKQIEIASIKTLMSTATEDEKIELEKRLQNAETSLNNAEETFLRSDKIYAQNLETITQTFGDSLVTLYAKINSSGTVLTDDMQKTSDNIKKALLSITDKSKYKFDFSGVAGQAYSSLEKNILGSGNSSLITKFRNSMLEIGKTGAGGEALVKYMTPLEKHRKEVFNKWSSLGKNDTLGGYNAGISDKQMLDKTFDKGAKIGEKSEEGARHALDSHSPSRVFTDMGKDTVIGFVNGIKEFEDKPKQAMSNVIQKMNSEMKKLKFKFDDSSLENSLDKMLGKLQTFSTKFRSGVNSLLSKFTTSMNGIKVGSDNKLYYTKMPQIYVPRFEQGGYPDKASLFFANENGIPELVGRIGNQTAVANNDQITTALTSALLTALSGADLGGQGTIVVNIGNKKVYEGMGEHIDSESERYGTSYVNI